MMVPNNRFKSLSVLLAVTLVCLHRYAVGNWSDVIACFACSVVVGVALTPLVFVARSVRMSGGICMMIKLSVRFIAFAIFMILHLCRGVVVVAAMTSAHVARTSGIESDLPDSLSSSVRNIGVAISADSVDSRGDAFGCGMREVSSACVDGGGALVCDGDIFYDAQTTLRIDVPKVLCQECGFMVVGEGHKERCKVQEDPAVSYERRRRAWLGDVLHKLDVFFALLQKGKSVEQAKIDVGFYIHQESQSRYIRAFESRAGLCADGHAAAQVFESCYLDSVFRQAYLERVFGIGFLPDVQGHVARFNHIHESGYGLDSENYSLLSFVGEQLFTYDVRSVILRISVDNHGLQPMFSSYTSASALATYVNKYGAGTVPSRGSSNSSIARAFKASWYGEYRDLYLHRMFGCKLE